MDGDVRDSSRCRGFRHPARRPAAGAEAHTHWRAFINIGGDISVTIEHPLYHNFFLDERAESTRLRVKHRARGCILNSAFVVHA